MSNSSWVHRKSKNHLFFAIGFISGWVWCSARSVSEVTSHHTQSQAYTWHFHQWWEIVAAWHSHTRISQRSKTRSHSLFHFSNSWKPFLFPSFSSHLLTRYFSHSSISPLKASTFFDHKRYSLSSTYHLTFASLPDYSIHNYDDHVWLCKLCLMFTDLTGTI